MKAGDVVRLKSGGPPMTVRAAADGKATCQWLDKDGGVQSYDFLESQLSMQLSFKEQTDETVQEAAERGFHGR